MPWVQLLMISLKERLKVSLFQVFPAPLSLFQKRLSKQNWESESSTDNAQRPQIKIPLARLLQRSFLKTALIPLLAVELILVLAFLVTHRVSTASQVAVQRVAAQENLVQLVQAQTEVLTQELDSVAVATELYQRQTLHALTSHVDPDREEQSRYYKTPEGAFATQRDNGGAAAFYSNLTPIGSAQLQKIWQTAQLDSLMKDQVESHPLITQLYFNSFDSYNRIYPYRDIGSQYTPDLNIPTYNFYYLADAQHNPQRGVVWTDAYLDPAGQGWMVSCIAPVYRQDFLEGVVGSDITLEVLIQQVLSTEVPWNGYALLLAQDGTILAMPPSAEQEWGLQEKTNHHYTDFVLEDTSKPEEFNLFRRAEMQGFSAAVRQQFTAFQTLELDGVKKLAAWSHIPATNWIYLVIVPEQEVFARTQALGQQLLLLGKAMIGGMIIFYALFVLYLVRSGQLMSRRVAEPLEQIGQLVNAIANGQYNQPLPAMQITELDHAATQVVEMGKTLGERTDALMKALTVKSSFLGVVSHELRTPMNGILGMGELLRQTQLDATQQDFVDTMLLSGENLMRLLNDILDMSKLEARSLTLNPRQFDLQKFLQQKAVLWKPQIEQKGLEFSCHLAPDLPRQVIGDRERLHQMLNNYLNNALKFTETGHICLQVGRAVSPAQQVAPTASTNRGTVETCCIRFAVIDTGIGIPESAITQLFRPFTQVENSLQRSYDGAGLGLSIVKELAEQMDGTVGVESVEGKGSTFWFEICLKQVPEILQPVLAASPSAPPVAPALPASSLAGSAGEPRPKILLAEDNKVNQKFALICLKQLGAVCDIAANGREAVDLFMKHSYAIVLMDIHMPEMDGITALQKIREIDPAATVVAVTADAFPEVRDRLLKEGFNEFMEKPFRVKDMKEVLLRLNCLPGQIHEKV